MQMAQGFRLLIAVWCYPTLSVGWEMGILGVPGADKLCRDPTTM